jgi:hypothetical protein
LRDFNDFADEITDLFRAASDNFVARQIHALPGRASLGASSSGSH